MLDKKNRGIQQFGVLVNLLRDRQSFLEEIRQGIRLQNKISSLFVTSSIFFALYGAIIGASHSWAQALSGAIKLPAILFNHTDYLFPDFVLF